MLAEDLTRGVSEHGGGGERQDMGCVLRAVRRKILKEIQGS